MDEQREQLDEAQRKTDETGERARAAEQEMRRLAAEREAVREGARRERGNPPPELQD
jgi:hypothetical protein